MLLCGISVAVGAEASLSDALALVDRLAWSDTDRQVDRELRRALSPRAVYARSLRTPQGIKRSPPQTLYAVSATLAEGDIAMPLQIEIRQAIVYRNPSRVPLEEIVLRVFPAESAPVTLRGVWVGNERLPGSSGPLRDSILRVPLPEPLGPGQQVRMLVELQEWIPAFDPGQALASDQLDPRTTGTFGTHGANVNLGFWLPIVTRLSPEGVFDDRPLQPNTEHATYDPALFHVVLELPAAFSVATTGVEILREAQGDRATVVAVARSARDFAVQLGLGMAILETEVGGTRLRVFHPAEQPAMGRHLLEYAEGALRTCVASFGSLDVAEIDVVEAPIRVAHGMEYPGLVTVDVHHKDGLYSRDAVHEWTVAHEIAHQWWSAEVGSESGDAPWLDEGLAAFSAALYWEERYGAEALQARHYSDIVQPTRSLRDQGRPDLPADGAASTYDLRQYSAIVYGRAALFFEVLANAIGRDAVLAGLRSYHDTQRGQVADAQDLVRAIQEQTDDPVQVIRLYERWITEAHGYEDLLGR